MERFHLDAGRWFQGSEPVPHLAAVSEAVWASRRLEIAYRRDDGAVTRAIEPLGIVLKARIWYVVARTEDQVARTEDQLRTYRVSRIQEARVLNATFERPAGFERPATPIRRRS
jgi:predicted DNA-binding transcriptional regulator YafY